MTTLKINGRDLPVYALDTEWDPDGNFLFGAINGNGERYTFERGKTSKVPPFIDGVALYYVAMQDIALSQPYVKFTQYLDLSVLIKIWLNHSTHAKELSGGKGLQARCLKYLGRKEGAMRYKAMDFTSRTVTELLRKHCREDVKFTMKLAEFIFTQCSQQDIDDALRMEKRNEPWREIAKTHICYDYEHQKSLIDPDNLVRTLNDNGIDCFSVVDGRLRISRGKMQEWLRRNHIPVPIEVSNVSYAQNGLLYAMRWEVFEDLARGAKSERIRHQCNLMHLALRSHMAMTGEARFNSSIIHPVEVCCSQASGRVSHINDPISAGVIFRMNVIPPEGYVTLSLDIKSQEVYLAALMSEDEDLQRACEEDVYSYLAAVILGKPYVRLKKGDTFRDFIKNIVLPWLYGIAAESLAETMGCEPAFARMVLMRLDFAFPKFWMWKQCKVKECVTARRAYTMLDRFPLKIEPHGDVNMLQVLNHNIQGTGCDMLAVWVRALVDAGFVPFGTLHDGVYIYIPKDFDEKIIVKISEDALNKAIPLKTNVPSFNSWVVESSRYPGLLMEKEGYWDLLASLRDGSVRLGDDE